MKSLSKTVNQLFLLIVLSPFVTSCTGDPLENKPKVDGDTFSMIIGADPQIWWYRGDQHNSPEGRKTAYGTVDTTLMAMTQVDKLVWPNNSNVTRGQGTALAQLVSIVQNGDLTAYWHPDEKNTFFDLMWKYKDKWPSKHVAPLMGLGNHDYANNRCSCSGHWPHGLNSCARNALHEVRKQYGNRNWINFDQWSLAYSYDFKDYHFVQLHLTPSYESGLWYTFDYTNCVSIQDSTSDNIDDCKNDLQVKKSISWLKKDLESANGKKTILFMHALMDDTYWTTADRNTFDSIIGQHNVVAIFGGHLHDRNGYQHAYGKNVHGDPIPFFRSGAPEYFKFLVVQFGLDYMNVGVVDSKTGNPVFFQPGDSLKMKTYTF